VLSDLIRNDNLVDACEGVQSGLLVGREGNAILLCHEKDSFPPKAKTKISKKRSRYMFSLLGSTTPEISINVINEVKVSSGIRDMLLKRGSLVHGCEINITPAGDRNGLILQRSLSFGLLLARRGNWYGTHGWRRIAWSGGALLSFLPFAGAFWSILENRGGL
jgi:hypothetical protein